MAKKYRRAVKTARSDPRDSIELRRWCIEQALCWPHEAAVAAPAGQTPWSMGGPSTLRGNADIIGKATAILEWVKQAQ